MMVLRMVKTWEAPQAVGWGIGVYDSTSPLIPIFDNLKSINSQLPVPITNTQFPPLTPPVSDSNPIGTVRYASEPKLAKRAHYEQKKSTHD